LVRKNHKLVLIDADPQGSATTWHNIEDNQAFEIMHHADQLTPDDIEAMEIAYDYVIIDAPPAVDENVESILSACHLAIIPVTPSSLDLWSCKSTLDRIDKGEGEPSNGKVRLLINRKIPGTRVGREVRQALEEFNAPVFETELCQRVAYIDAMKYGVSVMQFAPGSKAASEIEQWCEEVLSLKSEEMTEDDAIHNAIATLYQEETDNILFRSFQHRF
jgi:chromosome partitioning protein